MFSYYLVEEGPFVQILYGENVIDESGPWESISAAVNWAEAYVAKRNAGVEEPEFP
jgi:hypothetical protein